MRYENNFYRTSDGLLDIEFLFVDLGGSLGWRAYILSRINYKMFSASRSDSCSTVHRLTENREDMKRRVNNFMNAEYGRELAGPLHYICWTNTIHSLEDMRTLAKTWSEITAYYIRHGTSFEKIQPKLKAQGKIDM